jgi:hypothetical protein
MRKGKAEYRIQKQNSEYRIQNSEAEEAEAGGGGWKLCGLRERRGSRFWILDSEF